MLGRELDLEVTNVAHGGISVARHDGRVIFVSDAIPGETVRARITEDSKKSFWRAETLAVIEPSAFRQPHVWSAASIDRDPRREQGVLFIGGWPASPSPARHRSAGRRSPIRDRAQIVATQSPRISEGVMSNQRSRFL